MTNSGNKLQENLCPKTTDERFILYKTITDSASTGSMPLVFEDIFTIMGKDCEDMKKLRLHDFEFSMRVLERINKKNIHVWIDVMGCAIGVCRKTAIVECKHGLLSGVKTAESFLEYVKSKK